MSFCSHSPSLYIHDRNESRDVSWLMDLEAICRGIQKRGVQWMRKKIVNRILRKKGIRLQGWWRFIFHFVSFLLKLSTALTLFFYSLETFFFLLACKATERINKKPHSKTFFFFFFHSFRILYLTSQAIVRRKLLVFKTSSNVAYTWHTQLIHHL